MDTKQATRVVLDVATKRKAHPRQTLSEAVTVLEAMLQPKKTGKSKPVKK